MEISREKQLEREVSQLKQKVRSLEWSVEQYKKYFADLGSPYQYRLTGKVDRQNVALNTLNRRVLSQRFYFNLLKDAGKDFSKEDYLAAKAAWEAKRGPESKDRILDYETLQAEPELVS